MDDKSVQQLSDAHNSSRVAVAAIAVIGLVSLHVVYEAPMGALGIGSVATGAQGPHGLA